MTHLLRRLLCCIACMAAAVVLYANANGGCGPRHGCLSSSAHMLQRRVTKVDWAGARAARASPTGDMVGWEMRWVPSGPDPLHHNSSPKKPKTP